jgi:hypothetical protein
MEAASALTGFLESGCARTTRPVVALGVAPDENAALRKAAFLALEDAYKLRGWDSNPQPFD